MQASRSTADSAADSAADEVLADTVAGLPWNERSYLAPARLLGDARTVGVSLARVQEAEWLEAQIDLQALRWPTVDARVRTTLWWYSVSHVFLTPTIASLFVTGRALSPRPNDLRLHVLPDGRILTARSAAVLDDDDPVKAAATALRDSLDVLIPAVARAGAIREPPLWALATDSLANRLLWVGRARGEVDRAAALAARLAELVGWPLPAPRFVDVARQPPRPGHARFVRRASCCLIYLEPGTPKCASCPRLAPAERTALLRRAAGIT